MHFTIHWPVNELTLKRTIYRSISVVRSLLLCLDRCVAADTFLFLCVAAKHLATTAEATTTPTITRTQNYNYASTECITNRFKLALSEWAFVFFLKRMCMLYLWFILSIFHSLMQEYFFAYSWMFALQIQFTDNLVVL